MLGIGLALTAVGAVVGVGIAFEIGAPLGFSVVVSALAFGACGFSPMILGVLTRPWRYLVGLEISAEEMAVRDSGGKTVRVSWSDPDLSVMVLEPVGTAVGFGRSVRGEQLLLVPGFVVGSIGPDARAALLDAAAARGLTLANERYWVRGKERGSGPMDVIAHSAARTGLAIGWPSPEPSVEPPPLATSENGPMTFDVSALKSPTYDGSPPARNTLRSVTVSPAGFEVVDAKGRTLRREWQAPKVHVEMFRRLASPLDPLARSGAVWHLRAGSGPSTGAIGSDCYAAIVASASRAGVPPITHRHPQFSAHPRFWLASSTIDRKFDRAVSVLTPL